MQSMYYIGLDVHKRKISYCVKDPSGAMHSEGSIPATRFDLDRWMKTLPQPWSAAIEATVFTGWIYDHLKPHAAALKVAHPLLMRAIAAAKKKNDRIDANKIYDCLIEAANHLYFWRAAGDGHADGEHYMTERVYAQGRRYPRAHCRMACPWRGLAATCSFFRAFRR